MLGALASVVAGLIFTFISVFTIEANKEEPQVITSITIAIFIILSAIFFLLAGWLILNEIVLAIYLPAVVAGV